MDAINRSRSLMHLFLLQELMDQHPLGETDTTIKPSQKDNVI